MKEGAACLLGRCRYSFVAVGTAGVERVHGRTLLGDRSKVVGYGPWR